MKHFLIIVILINIIYLSNCVYPIDGIFGFKCFGITNIPIPIRINNFNQIECFSINGKECISNLNSEINCRKFVKENFNFLKPFTCSEDNKKDKLHWCFKAVNFFYNKWHCENDTGIDIGIKLNVITGDVMCLSFNGKTCLEGKFASKICKKANICKKTREKLKPIICGINYVKMYSNFGYNFPSKHWCKKSYAFFKYDGIWYSRKYTGLDTLITMTTNGDIICVSENEGKCRNDISESESKRIKNNKDNVPSKNIICKLQKNNDYCIKSFNFYFNEIFDKIKTNDRINKEVSKSKNKILRRQAYKKIGKLFKKRKNNLKGKSRMKKIKSLFKVKFNTKKWDMVMQKRFGKNYKELYFLKYGRNWKIILRDWWNKKHQLTKSKFKLRFGSKSWKNYLKKKFGSNWRIVFLKNLGNNWRIYLKNWWLKNKLKLKS